MRLFSCLFAAIGLPLFAAPAPIIVDNFSTSSFTGSSSASGTTIQISIGSVVNFQEQSTAGDASINIDGTSSLNFSQTSSNTYTGLLTGSGTVMKNGTGNLTMTGNNIPFTGPLIVQTGTLFLDGSYGGSVSVSPSATIIYGGAISGDLNVNAGTITTAGVTTLTVGGNYTQSGNAIYIANINGLGQSSLISMAGTADIGGFLGVDTTGGVLFNHRYTVLHANGGVTGIYTLSGVNPALTPIVTYDANNVYISFGASFVKVALTKNEQGVAKQFDSITSPTPDEIYVMSQLSSLDVKGTQKALNLMSGEQYTDFLLTTLDGDNRFSKRIYAAYRELINPCVAHCSGVNT